MKVIMYGSSMCPDTTWAQKKILEKGHIELEHRVITDDLGILKEFLAYRDKEEIFKAVIEEGIIGIPFFILEDGTKTLDFKDFINLS